MSTNQRGVARVSLTGIYHGNRPKKEGREPDDEHPGNGVVRCGLAAEGLNDVEAMALHDIIWHNALAACQRYTECESRTQCHDYYGQEEAHRKLEKHTTLLIGEADADDAARSDRLQVLAYTHRRSGKADGRADGEFGRCVMVRQRTRGRGRRRSTVDKDRVLTDVAPYEQSNTHIVVPNRRVNAIEDVDEEEPEDEGDGGVVAGTPVRRQRDEDKNGAEESSHGKGEVCHGGENESREEPKRRCDMLEIYMRAETNQTIDRPQTKAGRVQASKSNKGINAVT